MSVDGEVSDDFLFICVCVKCCLLTMVLLPEMVRETLNR